MKLIILRSNLKEGLSAVERAVVDNNNLPILKNVLFKADTRVTLQATNLEIGVTFQTNAKIQEPGVVSIPFAPFNSIIQNSVSERIVISTEGNTLTVTTDNYEAKLQGLPAEEFPIIPNIEEGARTLQINTSVFKSAITEISGAAAVNDLKPELNSILFDVQHNSFKAAATDGFRLAEKNFPHNTFGVTTSEPIRALVPLKTIQEVARAFPEGEQLTISFDEHQVLFSAKDIMVISRLVDGTYPDYTAIIPKQTTTEIVVDREQFVGAVKLVSNFSGRGSDVSLRMTSDEKQLAIFAANQLVGENVYHIPVKKKGGEIKEVVFNWRYLLDAIRALPGETISLALNGEAKPVLFKSTTDDSVFYIVMPIQK